MRRLPSSLSPVAVVVASLAGPMVLSCADDTSRHSQIACGEPRLTPTSAAPFDWIEVRGLPDGLVPAVADVTLPDGTASVLAPVVRQRDGSFELRVPIHPSFQIGGGAASVRIRSENTDCRLVPLTIESLEPAPGAMAETTEELRRTVDEITGSIGAGPFGVDPSWLTDSGDGVPLMAVPALWTLPELERLERLVAGDSIAVSSVGDAELLDAVAGRLELPGRMREFRGVVQVANELIGTVPVTVPAAAERVGHGRPARAQPFRFAAHTSMPTRISVPGRPPGAKIEECPSDPSNLFDIAEPAELDNLMRAQDYAERFLAGMKDEEGGSAAGTVFGDIGFLASSLQYAGKAGGVASSVWDAFSTVVLNTADAYTNLLPGDMELTVTVDRSEFEEDSEETGRWTASAVASSRGMKLTEKVIEKVMEKALEMGLSDASIGKELTDDGKLADELDKRLLEEPTKAALGSLLDAIGATKVEGGFDIPAGCWSLGDMSASDDPSESSDSPPPLVTGHLSGDAVEFTESANGANREYKAMKAGTSRLEVRTAEGYRKAFDVVLAQTSAGAITTPVATTYAFGGDQYVAATQITVNEIEINLNPTIVRVEPGDRVPFVATVENAVDTRVRWTSSANPFDEIVDFGEGTHEVVLIAPGDPNLYPITVEVESMSRSGPRESGLPVRKTGAVVQLADPILAITPTRSCLSPGDTLRFAADLLGVGGSDDADGADQVRWNASSGQIDEQGLFRAPDSEGTYEVTATWAEDSDVGATAMIQVGANCCGFSATVSAGPEAGGHRGPAWLLGGGLVLGDVSGKWETRVGLPDTEPGTYESEMQVIAHVPNPYEPGETVGASADAPDGLTTHPVTIVIEAKEGSLGMARADGSIEGHLEGRGGWRNDGGDVYFDLQASFKAIPYSVSSRGRYQQCRELWGLESSGDLMRRQ